MRQVNRSKAGWNTLVAFSLIPLSGFAMDVFIPSLPDMSAELHAAPAAIQLTLSIFIITYGISQLLVGGLIDSFGRYLPNLISILVFSIASFVIANTNDLQLIYWMRAVQGLTVAVIMVSKRAYFVDMFTGEKLKKYTSLFSVIWAIAPIVAPFLGGFFQMQWGWASNFTFLGYFGLAFFVIELFIGGESMKAVQPFRAKTILNSYGDMIRTRDFSTGVVILGLTYAMILVYGMASPFLIENRLHFSASVTGYCSLFSGVAVMLGGTLSRMLIKKPFFKKLIVANGLQLVTAAAMIPLTMYYHNLVTLLLYVFVLHTAGGFIFNNMLSYCLMRFPQHAGKASGLVGGGFAVVTSIVSSVLVNSIAVVNQAALGIAYGILGLIVFIMLVQTKWKDAGEKPISGQIRAEKKLIALKVKA